MPAIILSRNILGCRTQHFAGFFRRKFAAVNAIRRQGGNVPIRLQDRDQCADDIRFRQNLIPYCFGPSWVPGPWGKAMSCAERETSARVRG